MNSVTTWWVARIAKRREAFHARVSGRERLPIVRIRLVLALPLISERDDTDKPKGFFMTTNISEASREQARKLVNDWDKNSETHTGYWASEELIEAVASALTAERTKALEDAAKAQCQFCAAPETYEAAALIEGSLRLWHVRHDDRTPLACDAAAVRALIGTPASAASPP